ncbi:carbohydrate ABC transporter substrate-binding protein [Ruania alkalisoli]|uniref:Carbohydrate ABC transporter substrate-binding protein n=1 Tax=Ruania alkalisoli TaxID=2779775 RepID=A0A7M1SUM0_9MICO|nr:ABC transporter substrate-binding protein [Ruania alkalisoli]QOR70634.1 carbohydrate ABC transporter substrate-binding protein [Ruania alkalisoli]
MTQCMRRKVAATSLAATGALLLAGCLQQPGSGSGSGFGPDNAETDSDGVVTILGAFGGAEAEAFNASLEEFEERTGIDVEYTSDQDFTNTIRARTGSGQAPDVAIFPQPGGLMEQAAADAVQPVDLYLDMASLEETLVPGFLDAATDEDGRVYGAPMRMAVKSLVWYPQDAYAAGGYSTEPETLDDLADIAQQIRDDGVAPWCMGWESDQATGWVGTDWIEEYMLRLHGPEVYDQWTSHEIPFNDPRVIEAFDAYGDLIFEDGNVLGGPSNVLAVPFSEAILPAFEEPAECLMERQGNFITGFMPSEIQANLDSEVGLFVFPRSASGDYTDQPILGGGDLAALMNGDDPDSISVMQFLTSDSFGGPWAQAGGWLSPHSTFDASLYPDELTRRTAEIVADADVFRFDGSDLMPNAVGGGTFWTGMVDWVNGASAEDVTTAIEESWPVGEGEDS